MPTVSAVVAEDAADLAKGHFAAMGPRRSCALHSRLYLAAFIVSVAMPVSAIAQSRGERDFDAAEKQFARLCSGCDGTGAAGGDRAPALTRNRAVRGRSESEIADLIRKGTKGGMPGFALADAELRLLAGWIRSLNESAFEARPGGSTAAGEDFFFGKGGCSACHMVHGRGRVNGPDLSDIGRKSTLRDLELALDNPTSQMGAHTTATCPGWAFCPDETWQVVNVRLRDGSTLRGFARNRAEHDLQLLTFDGKTHLLAEPEYLDVTAETRSYMPALRATAEERRNLLAYLSGLGGTVTGPLPFEPEPVPADAMRAVTNPERGEWPTYNGVPGGNRHSALSQINVQNAKDLQLQWIHSVGGTDLETTPLVSDGVMYVTAPHEVCALDSRTGREIWCYMRDSGTGAADRGSTFQQPNRGVALVGDRIFFASDDAHLICLNRLTGGVMWDVEMPQTPGNFYATSAPLVVGDLVISGVGGGDGPLRGFLAAYRATTGREAWRFWTVPKRGEPPAGTWDGKAIETGGGATWLTGSYDAGTGTLYWAVGNPFPAADGDERQGANLYTNCVVALEAKTGKLRWYYQFTPHDLHDWDATEPFLLVDTTYQGRPRKLLLQANRNGFFYVLDRISGELLLAKPFIRKLNWASGIDADGKPLLLPANKPTTMGIKACPAVRGATNWYSTAFNPETNLFYVMAVEDCSIYKQSQRGGYEGYRDPADPGAKYLRALNIETGEVVWEVRQAGAPEMNYSGVLSTAGGLLFYGESGGGLAALDARTGKNLWTFKTNGQWKASPMTYMMGGRQYVAIASGGNILSFAIGAR